MVAHVATNMSPTMMPITAMTIGAEDVAGIGRRRCGNIAVPGGGDIGGGDMAEAECCCGYEPGGPVIGLNAGCT